MRDALAWYLVVQVAGLAIWPIAARALGRLDDRGWGAAKAAGALGVAWLAWLVCMLTPVPFTRVTLLAALVVIGAVSWLPLVRIRAYTDVLAWLRARRALVIAWELIFLVAFTGFAVLRSHDPSVLGTEKPMDMAFLNGFIAAQQLPTQDTWLAGFGVPYYHFGYFVLACLAKLSGAPPGVAYNLAAATIPALAMLGMVALVWNLARAASIPSPWSAAGALSSAVLGLLCGNLETFLEYLFSRGLVGIEVGALLSINHFADGVVRGVWPPGGGLWWFHASRIIPNLQPDGINEFPFFTAFLSDLHPHFMAWPFELLVLTVAAAHVVSRGETLRCWWTQCLAGVALGGLLVMNTWDIAPFWLLYWALSAYAVWLSRRDACDASRAVPPPAQSAADEAATDGTSAFARPSLSDADAEAETAPTLRSSPSAAEAAATLGSSRAAPAASSPTTDLPLRSVPDVAALVSRNAEGAPGGGSRAALFGRAVATPFVGAALYAPYFVGYAGPPLGLGIVTERTPFGSLLVIFGWAIALLFGLGLFTRWCVGGRRGWLVLGAGAALGAVLAVVGQPTLGLLVAVVTALLPWPGVLDRFAPSAAMALGIGAFAAAMLLGVEVVYLNDVFHSRMNTVFKFHENAWLLAAIAAGVGLALVGRFARRARWAMLACAAAFGVAGLVYPISAIASRVHDQPAEGVTLDGTNFLPPDYRAAVRWLSDQNAASGRVVLAEGVGDEYDWSAGGMATFSGAATVLGWSGHELQWRGPLVEFTTRSSDMAALYRDAPPESIRTVLDRYAIRFVVVSDLERRVYGDGVAARFESLLPVAFRSGNITIYRAR